MAEQTAIEKIQQQNGTPVAMKKEKYPEREVLFSYFNPVVEGSIGTAAEWNDEKMKYDDPEPFAYIRIPIKGGKFAYMEDFETMEELEEFCEFLKKKFQIMQGIELRASKKSKMSVEDEQAALKVMARFKGKK